MADGRGCARSELGAGIAYAVDSRGEAVGDDEPYVPAAGVSPLHSGGSPMLWHGGQGVRLSTDRGSAYAISQRGVIVGTLSSGPFATSPLNGFVAYADNSQAGATPLDRLVVNLGKFHVLAGLGITNDGRILCLVNGDAATRQLAELVPAAAGP